VPPEHVGLDAPPVPVEGRVGSHGDGGGIPDPPVGQPPGVDAVGGDDADVVGVEVRRRVAQLAAALRAVHDLAAHEVGTAEHGGGRLDVAGRERLPHPGGGPPPPRFRIDEVAQHDGLEAVPLPEVAERPLVPGVPGAEPGVLPHHHGAGVEQVDEVLLHELLRRQLGERQRVPHEEGGVHPHLLEGGEPLPEAGELHVVALRVVHEQRVRGERDRHGGNVVAVGERAHATDHGAVAAVHACEHPERGH